MLFATNGGGKVHYTQGLPLTLTISGGSLARTYTSNFTVTITAGPGT